MESFCFVASSASIELTKFTLIYATLMQKGQVLDGVVGTLTGGRINMPGDMSLSMVLLEEPEKNDRKSGILLRLLESWVALEVNDPQSLNHGYGERPEAGIRRVTRSVHRKHFVNTTLTTDTSGCQALAPHYLTTGVKKKNGRSMASRHFRAPVIVWPDRP